MKNRYQIRVQIIDDDRLISANYADLLEETGFLCCHSYSLAEAVKAQTFQSFNLIICDYDLPDGKGLDYIKNLDANKDKTPVIFLTAAPEKIQKQAKEFSNVKCVLTKPFQPEKLLENAKKYSAESMITQENSQQQIERSALNKLFKVCLL